MSATIQLGLLGNGLERSRARDLHEMIGELLGLPVAYRPMDLAGRARVSIADELGRCAAEGFTGVNVTHPYKPAAHAAVGYAPGLPSGLTSINTVLFRRERMVGANTDCSGFRRAFRARFGAAAAPGRVLMLGAGGVGRAIAFALAELGASGLVVYDLLPGAAARLIDEMRATGLDLREAQTDLEAETAAADGLVNATPLGMFQYPGCAFPVAALGGQRWAFDAVYTPENTGFLAACRRRGIDTLSGFGLFLYQGLDAFELFTGVEPDARAIEAAFLERYPLE